MFLNYYTCLQLELFMVSVSGYMECVKYGSHNRMLWYITCIPHFAVLYHLYTMVLLISTSSVEHIIYIAFCMGQRKWFHVLHCVHALCRAVEQLFSKCNTFTQSIYMDLQTIFTRATCQWAWCVICEYVTEFWKINCQFRDLCILIFQKQSKSQALKDETCILI